MSTPTRQEIIDAYETLDMLLGFSEDRNPDLVPERRRIIEKALPPRPQPTMAEVEWDDDKHYLAEAEHFEYGGVIMLRMDPVIGNIKVLLNEYGEFKMRYAMPQNLVPTGKRYTLAEVQE